MRGESMMMIKKVMKNVAQASCTVIGYAGKKVAQGVYAGEKIAWAHRDDVAGGVVGVCKGVKNITTDLYGVSLTQKDFTEKLELIKEQSKEYERLSKEVGSKYTDKKILLDSLGLSADFTYNYAFIDNIPSEIQAAYAAAYPLQAQEWTLANLINSMNDEHLAGLVAGIKGKLFEMRYVDYLPDGFHAALAESATNPGWDIKILDADGNVNDVLHMKASDSVAYIEEALQRYPDIQIVTTEEVYSQLVMYGMAGNVIDSGISNAELTSLVEQAVHNNELTMHWGPPLITLLVIGYSAYCKNNKEPFAKGQECGERYVKAYLAYLVGGGVACMANIWWVGLVASLGTRLLLGYGQKRFSLMEDLNSVIRENKKVIHKLQLICS